MNEVKVGDIVQHFKRSFRDSYVLLKNPNWGLYKIDDIAIDADTGKQIVVYSALYADKINGVFFNTYTRDYDEFVELLDTEKYPQALHFQKYRFQTIDKELYFENKAAKILYKE